MEKETPELPRHDFHKMSEIANTDYGKCYTIGNYRICPGKKLILAARMYGTATADAVGFFPEPSLRYGEDTMVIFAGWPFFDRSGLDIDWQTAELLSYGKHCSRFTDGTTLYDFGYGVAHTDGERYDRNTFKPGAEEKPERRNIDGVKELTEDFCVKGDEFYFGHYFQNDDEDEGGYILRPILESFDVPNLRKIVSKNGFETDYITDGKQVIFGGGITGYSTKRKKGEEYVIAENWMIEGLDFATLRVLGENLLADKNALYCGTEVIPFAELDGFKFILREM